MMLDIGKNRRVGYNSLGFAKDSRAFHPMSTSGLDGPSTMKPPLTMSHPTRSRLRYALLSVLVMAAGLLWRARFMPLPSFLTKYGGDALWALLVFVGLGCVFKQATTQRLALGALGFSWVIEFSQLYHAPWIDTIRGTLPGRLILGSTFNWPDLSAYLLGITMGAGLEFCFHRRAGLTPDSSATR